MARRRLAVPCLPSGGAGGNDSPRRVQGSVFDFALRAAESVTGIISANALVRPDGMTGMSAKSVKKKMKDKAFAANVSRDNIRECDKAGVPLDTFLTLAISAIATMPNPPGADR